MKDRLLEIIKFKTGGKKKDFAEIFGWTPQYLAKLLKGENFGLMPIRAIIEKFTDINARWFITGEGQMLESEKYTSIRQTLVTNLMTALDVEKYMPVMSSEELHDFEQSIKNGAKPHFDEETIARWEDLLKERNEEVNSKFISAKAKSDKSCKQKTAKK